MSQITPRELQRLFPNASKDVVAANNALPAESAAIVRSGDGITRAQQNDAGLQGSVGISRRFVVAVTPIGAPRMTQRDKWKKRPCVEKYFTYRDVLRSAVKVPSDHGSLILMFYIPMPQSWSLKKSNSMDGKWHQSKPDVDNLAKAVLDALFENDCAVWSIHVEKVWTVEEIGKVVIHFV